MLRTAPANTSNQSSKQPVHIDFGAKAEVNRVPVSRNPQSDFLLCLQIAMWD